MKIELVENGPMRTLYACPPGPFLYDGIVGFKSEYRDNTGFVHAFNEGGEYFWAQAQNHWEQSQLVVQPLKLVKA